MVTHTRAHIRIRIHTRDAMIEKNLKFIANEKLNFKIIINKLDQKLDQTRN